jgi:NitT/TauT family transport system permease protein
MNRAAHYFALTSVTVALVALWWAAVAVWDVKTFIIPSPEQVLATAIKNWRPLIFACFVTVKGALIGFIISIGIGIPAALLLHVSEPIRRTFYPLLVATQVIPVVVFAPILVIWFGFSAAPQIIVVVILCAFPIIVETYTGFTINDPRRLQLARTMGAGARRTFFKVILPGALPNVFNGLKIAATSALVGAIVAEFVSSSGGIGNLLLRATGELESALLFAGVLYISVIGFMLYGLIEWVERLVIPWHVSMRVA